MKKTFLISFFLIFLPLLQGAIKPVISASSWKEMEIKNEGIVLATKQIAFPQFPRSFNPSIISVNDGYLLSFRYLPYRDKLPWFSCICLVLLDDNFNPKSSPIMINTRPQGSRLPSQAEDARLFQHDGKIYLIYNDNIEKISPSTSERRDMFVAEVKIHDKNFTVSTGKKVIHKEKFHQQKWQKNWVPFIYKNDLFLTYSLKPHEVLKPNFDTGVCETAFLTDTKVNWLYGTLRGSTPPVLDGDEYLAFFHSGIPIGTPSSMMKEKWHYFMGAYTFSGKPPFAITSISQYPLLGSDFYKISNSEKNVIFPGGCVIKGDTIYVAYGKNDNEIWIATINKTKLKESLLKMSGN